VCCLLKRGAATAAVSAALPVPRAVRLLLLNLCACARLPPQNMRNVRPSGFKWFGGCVIAVNAATTHGRADSLTTMCGGGCSSSGCSSAPTTANGECQDALLPKVCITNQDEKGYPPSCQNHRPPPKDFTPEFVHMRVVTKAPLVRQFYNLYCPDASRQ